MTKQHIVRPVPPWRQPSLTICGRDLSKVKRSFVLTTDLMQLRHSERPELCEICRIRAMSWAPWDKDPICVVLREAEYFASFGGFIPADKFESAHGFARELWALGKLAEAYPDDFRLLVQGEQLEVHRQQEADFEQRRQELIGAFRSETEESDPG